MCPQHAPPDPSHTCHHNNQLSLPTRHPHAPLQFSLPQPTLWNFFDQTHLTRWPTNKILHQPTTPNMNQPAITCNPTLRTIMTTKPRELTGRNPEPYPCHKTPTQRTKPNHRTVLNRHHRRNQLPNPPPNNRLPYHQCDEPTITARGAMLCTLSNPTRTSDSSPRI